MQPVLAYIAKPVSYTHLQLLDGAVEVGGVPGQHVVQGLEVIQVDQVGVALSLIHI